MFTVILYFFAAIGVIVVLAILGLAYLLIRHNQWAAR